MLKVFFGFKGRIGRLNFWFSGLVQLVITSIVLASVTMSMTSTFNGLEQQQSGALSAASPGIGAFGIPFWAFPLFFLNQWISLAASIKRLHDLNRSGWWMLALIVGPLIPFVNIVAGLGYLIYLGFIPGTQGSNRFGHRPLSIYGGGDTPDLDEVFGDVPAEKASTGLSEGEQREQRAQARKVARENRRGTVRTSFGQRPA